MELIPQRVLLCDSEGIRDMLFGIENLNLPDMSKMPQVSDKLANNKKERNYREIVNVGPYVGIYYSEELGTVWKLTNEDARLTIHQQRGIL
jgi:hypothetical protein